MERNFAAGRYRPKIPYMRRRQLVASAVAAGIIVAILPLMLAFRLSCKGAIAQEQRKLNELADRGLRNATAILAQASDTLTDFAFRPVAPCTQEHIWLMRVATLSTRAVDQIIHFSHGLARCTSWGIVSGSATHPPPDLQLGNGMGMRLAAYPPGIARMSMVQISSSDHAVLIAPSRFLPMSSDETTRVAVFSATGALIAAQRDMDVVLASALVKGASAADRQDLLVALAKSDDVVVVAYMQRSEARMLAYQLLWYWIPPGAIGSVLFVYFVRRLLQRRLSVHGQLRAAIERRELFICYQPMVDLATGRCVGAEALLRWDSVDSGMIPPNLFIPLAEKHGFIGRITLQVLELVAHEMAATLAKNRDMHVSVNLSTDDMQDGKTLQALGDIVKNRDIRADQIWLEITEGSFLELESSYTFVAEARKRGHVVAIDDFGTGYSNLLALQELPLDVLKIDKSFVQLIGTAVATGTVTTHIISMAKALDLRIVAEGVETADQVRYLREQGVDWGQGWWYAKPMRADDFQSFAERCNGLAGGSGISAE
ncbi:EAL domain-containing protein [Cupriavidus necator]|uniref:EAL domain-containing protein n=1 Tax=Cupriavidus necator TaxID=106590 RepID=UPI00129ECCC5|nr:EAL domain-containing protein [Cupriavidus necator]